MNLYKKIFTELSEADVNYLIVGGVAVNLHGYTRFTGDIDILITLDEANLKKLDNLMSKLGYVERLPIKIHELRDKNKVKQYLHDKGMRAFTYIAGPESRLDLDILVEESLEFDTYFKNKCEIEVWDLILPVVSIDDLIGMKRMAGRDQDLIDLKMLMELK